MKNNNDDNYFERLIEENKQKPLRFRATLLDGKLLHRADAEKLISYVSNMCYYLNKERMHEMFLEMEGKC